uniref:Uncharacterized protein n=1 Tax=Arundo donax TaxID=35708 RepID=A0A0A8XMY8_ARUDO
MDIGSGFILWSHDSQRTSLVQCEVIHSSQASSFSAEMAGSSFFTDVIGPLLCLTS